MSPCRAVCAPQLTGNGTRSPCATFRTQGDPQQCDPAAPQAQEPLELRLSLLEPGPGRAAGLHRHHKSPWSTPKLDVNSSSLQGGL